MATKENRRRLECRIRQIRPGSILFIVIALLIVLAALGTLYLKASLAARASSHQFVNDAAISIQLEGISNAVTGVLRDDLNDDWGNLHGNAQSNGQSFYERYRGVFSATQNYSVGDVVTPLPPYPAGFPTFFVCIANVTGGTAQSTPTIVPISSYWRPTTHVPVTSSLVQAWLADRIPTLASGPLGEAPVWPNISQQAAQPTASTSDATTPSAYPTSVMGLPFEPPDGNPSSLPMVAAGAAYLNVQPTFTQVPTNPQVNNAQKVTVPAFYINGDSTSFIAGDADGDGIADCLLSRLPGMNVGGLTWYVGIRIIDNNSAINVNTAWSRDSEFQFSKSGPPVQGPPNYYGLFQTGVGLQELINAANSADSLSNLNNYRFGGAIPNVGTAYDETGSARTDFNFITPTDELYHQLIRRLDSPGFAGGSSPAQSLSWSDSAALASRFCLVGENTVRTGSPASTIENLLPQSTIRPGQSAANGSYFNSTPYGVHGTDADVAQWYLDNFNFDTSAVATANGETNAYGGVFPLRPFLTARNPVSNYVTPIYTADVNNPGEPICTQMPPWGATSSYSHFRGKWAPKPITYQYNDIVLGDDGFTYIWIDSDPSVTNTKAGPSMYNLINANPPIYAQWQLQPWSPNPTKANINTATFRELFRDFWCVMAGNSSNGLNATPYGQAAQSPNIYKTDPGVNPQCMFRSPLRDCTSNAGANPLWLTQLDPLDTPGVNTMQLRAALAAVNAMGLRSGSQDVISRTIVLQRARISPGPNQGAVSQTVQVRVFSSEPQPFITEVYANTYADKNDPNCNDSPNPKGYVAIELYNPYSVPLTLNNWQAGYITRTATTYPNLGFDTPGAITSIGPLVPLNTGNDLSNATTLSVVIPVHGYALLENFNSNFVRPPKYITHQNVNDAQYRPASMFPDAYSFASGRGVWYGPSPANSSNTNVVDVYVPGLSNVIADLPTATNPSPGGEFVLLRPRRADGTFTKSGTAIAAPTVANPASENYDEGSTDKPNLADLVPVDSYDFTGLQQTGPGASTYTIWSYIRPKGAPPAGQTGNFRATYPGPYSGSAPQREQWTVPENGQPADVLQEQDSITWANGSQPVFDENSGGVVGFPGLNFPPIQIFNLGLDNSGRIIHFPNSAISPSDDGPSPPKPQPPQYPFGTFARNGDMLEIPYIGSYRIMLASEFSGSPPYQTFVEMNSLPMDSAMAAIDDPNSTIEPFENIGRFIPLTSKQGFSGTGFPDYFSWTKNLFNYFTVQSTNDDYLPDVDPGLLDVTVPAHSYANEPKNPGFAYPPATMPPASGAVTPPNVTQTHNSDAAATNQLGQDKVGVDGLININTASWQILSMLPMVTPNDGDTKNYIKDNQSLAKAIVAWRNKNGPFTSIYDLNAVTDSNITSPGPYAPATSPAGFENAEGYIKLTAGGGSSGVSSANGLLTPPDPAFPQITGSGTTSGVAEDFQTDSAVLSRISNMITTRSDTFTVYIVLQGWSNAGTNNAVPVITRRYSFIADRSCINADPTSRSVKTVFVPDN